MVIHGLQTLEQLRHFSTVTESLGMIGALEMIHQELARRVAFVRSGKVIIKSEAKLLPLDYETLREMSKKYDHISESKGVSGQRASETCIMCCVHPPFRYV